MLPIRSTTLEECPLPKTLSSARGQKGIALLPFIPAGYPDLETTARTLVAVAAAGADAIEVGFPFSDPIADGPTIQEAHHVALRNGAKIRGILDAIAAVRGGVVTPDGRRVPLVSMVSYSLMYRHGPDKFVADLKAAGFDGLILPDLPAVEAEAVVKLVQAGGLETVLLVSPTTPAGRREKILSLCNGFVYYLAVSGITGARDHLPADLGENVEGLKAMTDLPVCVGFGVSQADHLSQLQGIADGAIVGSALVRRMAESISAGPTAIANAAAAFCRELRGSD